jgi:signal transduction histidine kinase
MEIDLQQFEGLGAQEEHRLEMHSVLNILSVVAGELSLIQHFLDGPWELSASRNLCQEVIDSLGDSAKSLQHLRRVSEYAQRILVDIDQATRNAGSAASPDIKSSLANVENVLKVLGVRAREIVARIEEPLAWRDISIDVLRANLIGFLEAVVQNSKGEYGVVFNIASQRETDYYVALDFEHVLGGPIFHMPPVLHDVLRDLVANARKYSKPGSHIIAGIFQDNYALTLRVVDDGIGIPESEVERVIGFGERGSNVQDHPTRGGGFGLTKAAWVAHRFGGEMDIDSAPGKGTTITISLPVPRR